MQVQGAQQAQALHQYRHQKGGNSQMQEIMQSLPQEDRKNLRDQLQALSKEDRQSVVSQISELDYQNMDSNQLLSEINNILAQISTTTTTTSSDSSISIYA